jgi:hypothetical protein
MKCSVYNVTALQFSLIYVDFKQLLYPRHNTLVVLQPLGHHLQMEVFQFTAKDALVDHAPCPGTGLPVNVQLAAEEHTR